MDARLRRIADYLLAQHDAEAIKPAAVDPDLLPHLFWLDIERDPAEASVRLRIRLVGTSIDRIFRRPLKGRYLEEFIHGPRGDSVIESFHHCAKTREPIWMTQIVHLKERMPRFVEIRLVPVQPPQSRVAISHDGGEWLVDLMGKGGGEFAHRCQPRHSGKVCLGVSQRFLGAPALGYVHDRADKFDLAGLCEVGLAHTHQVLDRTVGRSDPILMLEPASFAHGPVEGLLEQGPIFFVNPLHNRGVG